MGVLDDAIREHLELKRRRGATEAEIAKDEAEALGPARRDAEGSYAESEAPTTVTGPPAGEPATTERPPATSGTADPVAPPYDEATELRDPHPESVPPPPPPASEEAPTAPPAPAEEVGPTIGADAETVVEHDELAAGGHEDAGAVEHDELGGGGHEDAGAVEHEELGVEQHEIEDDHESEPAALGETHMDEPLETETGYALHEDEPAEGHGLAEAEEGHHSELFDAEHSEPLASHEPLPADHENEHPMQTEPELPTREHAHASEHGDEAWDEEPFADDPLARGREPEPPAAAFGDTEMMELPDLADEEPLPPEKRPSLSERIRRARRGRGGGEHPHDDG